MSDLQNKSFTLSRFLLFFNGTNAPPEIAEAFEQAQIESSLHIPAMATIIFHDTNLKLVDHNLLKPGTRLKVEAARDVEPHGPVIFEGEIVELELEMGPEGKRVILRAFDALHKLSRGTYTRAYVQTSDSDIFKKVFQETGLAVGTVDSGSTSVVHEHVVQYNQSNLDFLRQRAARVGCLLYAREDKIHLVKPGSQKSTTLNWGESLFSFRPRMTIAGQYTEVTVRSWDLKKKQAVVGQASSVDGKAVPKNGASRSSIVTFQAPVRLSDCRLQTQEDAKKLANAVLNRSASRFVEAEGTCTGLPGLIAGTEVDIQGVGERFKGKYIVTKAVHAYTQEEGYIVEFHVTGMNAEALIAQLLPEPEAPEHFGLVVGIVTNNKDPDKLGRVKLKFPWIDDEKESGWARVLSPGGGPDRGMFFLPEVNDEVLVGFQQNDINTPFVLGGLFNGKDKPPQAQGADGSGKVVERIVRSRTGHVISLNDDDSKGGVTLKDKKGNQIIISVDGDKITIEATGDIMIKSKSGSITLSAQKDIILDARGAITATAKSSAKLEASAKLDLKGSAGVKVEGATIDLN